ncbi:hypothetical protein LR48_Vigan561s007500 [Vigna angularis]|uniref:Uncharacterized protein n=2 Tax=Phaseolus angularis TaxID=3914 RepID=A0A0L9TDI5_PHAAN|nr:hypothetical protein LR48_Vigan561s007500 [Vigna angularis]BAT78282.1 hypothetical protein VIGAN_02094000 [Vigna angularis var. angularis]
MAFNSILCKSSSFVRALAVAGQLTKNNHLGYRTLIFSAINHHKDSFVPKFHFSSAAARKKPTSDENLLRVIESEIECAQETDDHNAKEGVPSNFPFKIIDSPGHQTIALERTYQDEEIKV